MNIINKIFLFPLNIKSLILIMILFLYGCKKNDFTDKAHINKVVPLQLFYGSNNIAPENVGGVDIMMFKNGLMTSSIKFSETDSDRIYNVFSEDIKENNLYCISTNMRESLDPYLSGNNTHISDILGLKTEACDYVDILPTNFYTSIVDVSEQVPNELRMPMSRSLARIDIKSKPEEKIYIEKCYIRNVPKYSYLFSSSDNYSSPMAYIDLTFNQEKLSSFNNTGVQDEFLYLYETNGKPLELLFIMIVDGHKTQVDAVIKGGVKRNTRYTIYISGKSASVITDININDWLIGGESDYDSEQGVSPIFEFGSQSDNIVATFSSNLDIMYVQPTVVELEYEFNVIVDNGYEFVNNNNVSVVSIESFNSDKKRFRLRTRSIAQNADIQFDTFLQLRFANINTGEMLLKTLTISYPKHTL